MAQRKSGKISAARQKAEEAAKKIQQKQARLLSLAEDFFAVTSAAGVDSLEAKIEEYKAKILELEDQIQESKTQVEVEQALAVLKIKEEGISNSEIAERLAISTSEVTAFLKLAKEQAATKTASAGQDAELEQTD